MSHIDTQIFRNEKGAIDLASIMVGIIVIGLIGGIIAATVFAIIPWAQDKAAKQQLDSIASAQTAYKGRASDADAISQGFNPNSYGSSEALHTTGLLEIGDNYCTTVTTNGYIAYALSASGKAFSITSANTSPKLHSVTSKDAKTPNCEFLKDSIGDDPDATLTSVTYKCDTDRTGTLPFRGIQKGKLAIKGSDGSETIKELASLSATNATFAAGVEYEISFDGTYTAFSIGHNSDTKLTDCVRSLNHWGEKTGVTNGSNGLYKATNLVSIPDSLPSTVKTLGNFFYGVNNFNSPNISAWDVSNVIDMDSMFYGNKIFNQPLADWDTSKVASMRYMFYGASEFDQPLSTWNTSEVVSMDNMFSGAKKFNHFIGNWDTSKVTNMTYMFNGASSFAEPLNDWDTSKVTDMSYMFMSATAFNQPLNDWDVSNVTTVRTMFYGASNFQQDLSSWKFNATPININFTTTLTASNLPKW